MFLFLLAAVPLSVSAQVDEERQAWLHSLDPPLYWDNVHQPPQRLSDKKADVLNREGYHAYTLQAGESVDVRIPAGSWLRLDGMQASFPVADYQVYQSLDNSMYTPVVMLQDKQGGAMISKEPAIRLSRYRIVRLTANPGNEVIALFLSRTLQLPRQPVYHRSHSLEAGGRKVCFSDTPGAEEYWYVAAGEEVKVSVEGALRLRLVSRLEVSPARNSAHERYQLEIYLDGIKGQTFYNESGDETFQEVTVARRTAYVARARNNALPIPVGRHMVTIVPSRNVYLQIVSAKNERDYLFHGNWSRKETQESVAQAGTSPWQYPLSSLSQMGAMTLVEMEQVGQRLAIDNSLQPGSLLAAELFNSKTTTPSLISWQRRQMGAEREKSSTFYTDILPMNGNSLTLHPLSVFRWHLDEAVLPPLLQVTKLSDLASRKSYLRFTALSQDPAQALQYHLPSSQVPRTFRVTACDRQSADDRVIYLQVDEQPPLRILLEQPSAEEKEKLAPEKKWLAASLQQSRGKLWPDEALALPWGLLPIPASARVIRFWGDKDILLALEIQKPAGYRPKDLAYRAAIEQLGQEKALQRFFSHLHGLGSSIMPHQGPGKEELLNELDNQWLPLLRFFAGEYHFYSRKPYVFDEGEEKLLSHQEVQDYQQRAEEERARGNPVGAIEFVSYAIRGLQGEKQLQVRMQRAELLVEQGEVASGTRELWFILSQSRSEILRAQALDQLIQVAQANNDEEQAVRILSSALIERPEAELLARLIVSLVTTGKYRAALELAALLPEEQLPLAHVFRAAVEEGWWGSFAAWLPFLETEEEQQYWLGWEAVKNLATDAAIAHWQLAGRAGEKEIGLLQTALGLRRAMADTGQERRSQAIEQWEAWQEKQQFRARWTSADKQVATYSMAPVVHYPDLGLSMTQYRVNPSHPLQLDLYGPTELRVTVRPLHEPEEELPLEDWLLIKINHEVRRFPIVGNVVDDSKMLAANSGERIGQRDQFVIDIPPGRQSISTALLNRDALMVFETKEAREYVSLLPPLTPALATRCFREAIPLQGDAEVSRRVRLIDREGRGKMVTTALVSGSAEGKGVREELNLLSRRQPVVEVSSETAKIDQLAGYLWKVEKESAPVNEIFLGIKEYTQKKYSNVLVRKVLQRLRRAYQWQEVTNLYQRAGVRDVPVGLLLTESPENRIREALLPSLDEGEVRIRSFASLLFAVEHSFEREFLFTLFPEAFLGLPEKTLHVGITLDDEKEKIIALAPGEEEGKVTMLIRAGSHSIRFRIIDPIARHSVRIKAEEKSEGEWIPFTQGVRSRSYHVSDSTTPLVVYVEGPGLVRVDEWERDTILSSYRGVAPGWNRLELKPSADKQESLYRVHQMVSEQFRESLPVVLPESALNPLPTASFSVNRGESSAVMPAEMQKTRGGRGTFSYSLNMVSRRYVDDDVDETLDTDWGKIRQEILDEMGNENFGGITFDYRSYLEPNKIYQKSSAFVRLREFGDQTLGVSTRWTLPTFWEETMWKSHANLYVQRPNAASDTEWLVDFRTELGQQRKIGYSVVHRPSIGLFARSMSLDSYGDYLAADSEYQNAMQAIDSQVQGDPAEKAQALLDRQKLKELDSDIFSNYKRDHRYGLKIEDIFTYNPFRDLSCWLKASVVSNENFNIFQPDYLFAAVGGRIFYKDVDFSLIYEVKRYLRDDDRERNLTRDKIRAKMNYRIWQTAAKGYSLGLRFEHDKHSGDNSGWLTLSLHRSSHRMMKDFTPGEILFKDLRQRRTLEKNNSEQDTLIR